MKLTITGTLSDVKHGFGSGPIHPSIYIYQDHTAHSHTSNLHGLVEKGLKIGWYRVYGR